MLAELTVLTERKRQLLDERGQVTRRREAWAQAQANLHDLVGWCRTVAANLGDLTYEQKRMALDVLGFGVRLFRADHEPRYVITANLKTEVASSTTCAAGHSDGPHVLTLHWTDRDNPMAS